MLSNLLNLIFIFLQDLIFRAPLARNFHVHKPTRIGMGIQFAAFYSWNNIGSPYNVTQIVWLLRFTIYWKLQQPPLTFQSFHNFRICDITHNTVLVDGATLSYWVSGFAVRAPQSSSVTVPAYTFSTITLCDPNYKIKYQYTRVCRN